MLFKDSLSFNRNQPSFHLKQANLAIKEWDQKIIWNNTNVNYLEHIVISCNELGITVFSQFFWWNFCKRIFRKSSSRFIAFSLINQRFSHFSQIVICISHFLKFFIVIMLINFWHHSITFFRLLLFVQNWFINHYMLLKVRSSRCEGSSHVDTIVNSRILKDLENSRNIIVFYFYHMRFISSFCFIWLGLPSKKIFVTVIIWKSRPPHTRLDVRSQHSTKTGFFPVLRIDIQLINHHFIQKFFSLILNQLLFLNPSLLFFFKNFFPHFRIPKLNAIQHLFVAEIKNNNLFVHRD